MKKVLIFTLSTGGGHNEVAANLRQEFENSGYEVAIIEVLSTLNKVIDSLFTKSFNIVTGTFPKFYGKLYKFSDSKKVNNFFGESAIKIFSEKIHEMILEEQPDLIISTHAFMVSTLCHLKNSQVIEMPYISMITDYTAHWAYANPCVDAYISASEYTEQSLLDRGISKDRVHPLGLPIKDEFLEDNYGLEDGKFKILLMSGSLGLKKMIQSLESIVDLEGVSEITVICGRNKKLKALVEEKFKDSINAGYITVYGFTNQIANLMNEADVLITKPGGITISEAIAKSLPMIIPYYIPGQEQGNLEYLLSQKIALYAPNSRALRETLSNLLADPAILKDMHQKMLNIYNKTYSKDIIELSDQLIHQYESKEPSHRVAQNSEQSTTGDCKEAPAAQLPF